MVGQRRRAERWKRGDERASFIDFIFLPCQSSKKRLEKEKKSRLKESLEVRPGSATFSHVVNETNVLTRGSGYEIAQIKRD